MKVLKSYPLKTFVFCSLIAAVMSNASPSVAEQSSLQQRCSKLTCFPQSKFYKNQELTLLGISDFSYLFFNVYTAALYVEKTALENNMPIDVLSGTTSIVLQLKYHRNISSSEFIDSTKSYLQKSSNATDNFSSGFEKLFRAYEDVTTGDSYTLGYVKESQETCLLLNSREVMCENGLPFFKTFAGIWLSEKGVGGAFMNSLKGM